MEDKSLWFPEPSLRDETFARHGERTFDWLARSTTERAKAVRRFLKLNIAKLPSAWQPELYRALESKDWDATLFELFVARALQLLGASIEVEVTVEATGRKPDFLASFSDSGVIVEATVPKTNIQLRQQFGQNEALINIIEPLVPDGWSVAIWRLPDLGPSESKQPFKQTVQRLLASLPRSNVGEGKRIDIREEIDSGELSMTMSPGSMVSASLAIASGPARPRFHPTSGAIAHPGEP